MKERKKKPVWGNVIAMAFFMMIGAVCGVLIMDFIEDVWGEMVSTGGKLFYMAFLLAGVYVALFLQTIFHEAGHLVFGLMTGYQFSSFRIMSFLWMKEGGRLRLRRISIAGTGGQCLMLPPEPVDGKMPVFLYNLGGSFGNLMVSVIALGLSLVWDEHSLLSVWLMMFTLIGIALALMNGIPMRMGAVDNDGYNAFSLRRSKEAQRAFRIQMKVSEQTANGVRLKDMPEEWFVVPSDEAMKNSMVAAMGVFACNRLVDAHRFGEADRLMAHLLALDSGIVGIHRDLMVCDRIYIELICQNRKEVLDGLLTKEQKKFMKSMKSFPSVIRTEYACALLGGQDRAKAGACKALFEKCAKTYPYPGDIQSERELMEIVEDKGQKSHGIQAVDH